jgi:3-oxoacyl-[acyl-carrier-protein] synthase III
MNEVILEEEGVIPFFDRPGVIRETIPVGPGIPFGYELVQNNLVGIQGIYGTWGKSYDNAELLQFIEAELGEPLAEDEKLDLAQLGFNYRHHLPYLSEAEQIELEIEVGARVLRQAALVNGWAPGEVEAVLLGTTTPVCLDYLERICHQAGLREDALKVYLHKACDGSAAAIHTALNPQLSAHQRLKRNIAEELLGKKVLAGGLEGLSRFVKGSRDKNALQFFGNGFGLIGMIPGKNIRFITGKEQEIYDEQGALAVKMLYPHSRQRSGDSAVEVTQPSPQVVRIAGLMHEPTEDYQGPIAMASMMGMVKLFVRNGLSAVLDVVSQYRACMQAEGRPEKDLRVIIAHHANIKINSLKEKQLQSRGVNTPMPWLLRDFGNISAASLMIAFLRFLPEIRPGDHVLLDGFGAGSYYDALVVEFPGAPADRPSVGL